MKNSDGEDDDDDDDDDDNDNVGDDDFDDVCDQKKAVRPHSWYSLGQWDPRPSSNAHRATMQCVMHNAQYAQCKMYHG